MTYEELIVRMREGDPIIRPGEPDPIPTDEGIVIPGIDDGGEYADDLRIRIADDDALELWWREPGSPDWGTFPCEFACYEDLCSWVYTL